MICSGLNKVMLEDQRLWYILGRTARGHAPPLFAERVGELVKGGNGAVGAVEEKPQRRTVETTCCESRRRDLVSS